MPLPIACIPGALTPEQRKREQELLAEFKSARYPNAPIENGYRFDVPGEPSSLKGLGELLALERLCCPFLSFRLSIGAARGPVALDVQGDDPAAQAFIQDTFIRAR